MSHFSLLEFIRFFTRPLAIAACGVFGSVSPAMADLVYDSYSTGIGKTASAACTTTQDDYRAITCSALALYRPDAAKRTTPLDNADGWVLAYWYATGYPGTSPDGQVTIMGLRYGVVCRFDAVKTSAGLVAAYPNQLRQYSTPFCQNLAPTSSATTTSNGISTQTSISTSSGSSTALSTAKVQCSSLTTSTATSTSPSTATATAASTVCTPPNGTGAISFGSCQATACNSGYYLSNGRCYFTTFSCQAINGSLNSGVQTYNPSTHAYSLCKPTACATGYSLFNGACLASVPQSCRLDHGSGIQTFSSSTGTYGACQANVCDTTYVLSAGTCNPAKISCSPTNGYSGTATFSATAGSYGACQAVACNPGYQAYNAVCVVSSIACVAPHGSGGVKLFSDGKYGACLAGTCDTGYTQDNRTCSPYRSCVPQNGKTGISILSNGSYGSCQATACNNGFTLFEGYCKANTISCPAPSDPHGQGIATFSASIGRYSDCSNSVTCDPGYTPYNSYCHINRTTCQPSPADSISNCTAVFSTTTGMYEETRTCASDYTRVGTSCLANKKSCTVQSERPMKACC